MALKMAWHQCTSERRRPPLGLKNLGNTCYLNSVLQCLTYTPPLAQFCLSSKHSSLCKRLFANKEKECPFCILERQIARSLKLDGPSEAPSKIQKCLNLFAEHFRWGRQEDAHEFLRYVIDACHNTCLKLLKCRAASGNGCVLNGNGNGGVSKGALKKDVVVTSTVMKEIFGGVLLSQVKCLSCKGESNKADEMMDISLDLYESNSLKDALSRFFQPEVLDGSNKYNCERCKRLSVSRKQMFILRAPNVLVVQLKRFEGIHGGKINRNIEFEEILELSNFMYKCTKMKYYIVFVGRRLGVYTTWEECHYNVIGYSGALYQSVKSKEEAVRLFEDSEPKYSLFGSIVHSGYSPESGHYYAYIKDAFGRWYCCNDSHVSLSSTQEVLSEKVYILFYLLTDQPRRSMKIDSPCYGVKPTDSNRSDTLACNYTAETSNSLAIKSNWLLSSNNDVQHVAKNAKQYPIDEKATVRSDLRGLEEPKITNHTGSSSVASKSAVIVENNGVQDLNGTGRCSSTLNVACQNNGTSNLMTGRRDPNCGRSSVTMVNGQNSHLSLSKRKFDDVESAEGLASFGDRSSCLRSNGMKPSSEELHNFKEVLASEARSVLRSCDWYGKVQDLVHAKKRAYTEAAGRGSNNADLKQELINNAKEIFIPQIPGSLKEHLIERLKAFSQSNSLLDI